jgi:hypothetical protein
MKRRMSETAGNKANLFLLKNLQLHFVFIRAPPRNRFFALHSTAHGEMLLLHEGSTLI